MAHFAKIDANNKVIDIMVIDNKNCVDDNGVEVESIGAAFCNSINPGRWIQCSYNNNIRNVYPGIGGRYVEDGDYFVASTAKPWNERTDEGVEYTPDGINPRNGEPFTPGELKAMEFFAKAGNPSWAETVLVQIAATDRDGDGTWL
jgi:hypothetical protein